MDPDPSSVDRQAADPDLTPDEAAKQPPMPSIIGSTLVMKGEMTLDEDLIIEGTFDGTITDEGSDTVLVRRIARVSGQITANRLQVEDGTNLENTILSGRISLADERKK